MTTAPAKTKRQKSLVLFTKSDKRVGVLKGKTFFKEAYESRHLFKKLGARGSWGIDYGILFKKLPEDGYVYIREYDKKILYMVSNRTWKDQGTVMHFKEGTADHYTQVFLPRELFSTVRI